MSNHVNRRNFLKLSATAGAALALAPAGVRANEKKMNKMNVPTRMLGKRTGIQLPILSMGVMNADNPSVVRAAYNSGIILFDTANGYQNGRNEEMLGEFFADKPRDSFVLATKVREAPSDNAASGFLEKFETSMKRLRMSYVDILYVHMPTDVNYAPVLEAMLKLKKDGRVKFIGASTHSNEPDIINAMVDNGNYDVVLTSYNYTQKHLAELNPAIARASEAGMGVVAMKTMAGGYLDRERTQKVNTRAALKWALQNPNIHTAIPGFTSFDMLEESLDAAANLTMSEEEKAYLAVASDSMYCQGCHVCDGQCAKGLPIPEMMRAYMYNYGYKNHVMAKEVIDELALNGELCGNCTVCSVKCTAGFQVAQKVKDITRLRNVPQEFLA
jgi:aryl-alcohol dehydrogenase-like predicted oxidoreductase